MEASFNNLIAGIKAWWLELRRLGPREFGREEIDARPW